MTNNIAILGGSGMLGSNISKLIPEAALFDSGLDLAYGNYREISEKLFHYETIYMCAGLVGGIKDNNSKNFDYLTKNGLMALNTISAATYGMCKNFFYISSSCAYPKDASQPFEESSLFNGPVEPTNEGYALAKLVGTAACRFARERGKNFKTLIPCNLYGPGDNFSESGHVVASLFRKIYEAKQNNKPIVEIWGDGRQRRELMYVEDAATAIVLASRVAPSHWGEINIGTGLDCSVTEIANTIANILDWHGDFEYIHTDLIGMPQKVLDVERLNKLKFEPKYSLVEGIEQMAEWYARTHQ